MQRRTLLGFATTALTLWAVLAGREGAAADERRELSILYTVNNQGYMEPCG
jgi:uncharacterized protein (DUF1501 family)